MNDAVINFTISGELKKQIGKQAQEEGFTLSTFCRHHLIKALKTNQKNDESTKEIGSSTDYRHI